MNGTPGQDPSPLSPRACAACAALIPGTFLACPACGQLVHADELRDLATRAEVAEAAEQWADAAALWRQAHVLLPPATKQHQRIAEKLSALDARVPAAPPAATPAPPPKKKGRAGLLAGLGSAALFLAGKAKALLIGLTQMKTLLSMAVALGAYTTVHGWKFAAGLVISIYVHEMGHVVWLRRYGIAATAPMFIPGFGAFVRLKQNPASPGDDARVGLAGPLWGGIAAVLFLAVGVFAGWPSWRATAATGAWINLFNLVPVWQLDGSRGFRALSRGQRGVVAAVAIGLALARSDAMLIILAIAASVRAAGRDAPERGDRNVLAWFVALLIGLTFIAGIARVP